MTGFFLGGIGTISSSSEELSSIVSTGFDVAARDLDAVAEVVAVEALVARFVAGFVARESAALRFGAYGRVIRQSERWRESR